MNPIGAHVSAAGGVHKAIDRALAIGCDAVQLFTGSPRVWRQKSVEDIDMKKLCAKARENDVSPISIHVKYLVNLATHKPDLVRKSTEAIASDMQVDAALRAAGIDTTGVVVHVGSHQGRGWMEVREDVRDRIQHILEETPKESTFLIENSAGQKGKVNSDLSEIRWLLDEIDSPRLGWCLDTCHAHTAGYALGEKVLEETENIEGTSESPNAFNRGFLRDAIDELELWESLRVIHVNGSRDPYASGRDRHANLGEGHLPLEDIEEFLNGEGMGEYPLMLEVPGFDGDGPDAENVEILKGML
jgi:deoxyribonuclease-4